MLQKLHHVAYRCRDARETVDFYTNVLGLRFTHMITNDRVPSTQDWSPHCHIFFEMADGSYIAFFELPGRATQQMFARQIRPRSDERHAILQLIAKSISAARLIEGRTRPDAAGQRLIQQPAIEHDVHGAVGRLDRDGVKHAAPEVSDFGEGRVASDAKAIAAQRPRQAVRQVESAERNDRPFLWLHPIDFGIVAVVGHGKYATGIGEQQQFGGDGFGRANRRMHRGPTIAGRRAR